VGSRARDSCQSEIGPDGAQSGGVVRTRDIAQLSAIPAKGDAYMLELSYTVVEAFGRLKGYSGSFNSYGLFRKDSGEALVRYFGQICK
jgi:hypothetical protein